MTSWNEFCVAAPRIAEIFARRHAATGKLCMMGTLRADGSPRISPLEPRIFEGELWLAGMPSTRKFGDLVRDPRFCLHTATVDTQVSDGDAKLWGVVEDVMDRSLHQRIAQDLFEETGFDIRGQEFDHCFRADITSASSVEVTAPADGETGDGHMDVTIWQLGSAERVVRKH